MGRMFKQRNRKRAISLLLSFAMMISALAVAPISAAAAEATPIAISDNSPTVINLAAQNSGMTEGGADRPWGTSHLGVQTVESQTFVGNVAPNDYLLFDINVDQAGTYNLSADYASGNKSAPYGASIYLDGSPTAAAVFTSNADTDDRWVNFTPFPGQPVPVTLTAGAHQIKYVFNNYYFNARSLTLAPIADGSGDPDEGKTNTIKKYGSSTIFLAGDYSDIYTKNIIGKTANGEPYFWAQSGDWGLYHINVLADGDYQLSFGIATAQTGSLDVKVYMDGDTNPLAGFSGSHDSTGNWDDFVPFPTTKTISLTKGTHEIKVNFGPTEGYNAGTLKFTRLNAEPDILINQHSTTEIRLWDQFSDWQGLDLWPGDPTFLNNGDAGDYALYDIKVEQDGVYRITPDYATSIANDAPKLSLYLNSVQIGTFSNKEQTDPSWLNFQPIESKDVELKAGYYVLQLKYESGQFNTKHLKFEPVRQSVKIKPYGTSVVQLADDLKTKTNDIDVTPGSHISANSGNYAVYEVELAEDGNYSPTLYYAYNGATPSELKAQLYILSGSSADIDFADLGESATAFETSAVTGGSATFRPVSAKDSTIGLTAGTYSFVLGFNGSTDAFNARSLEFTRVGIGEHPISGSAPTEIHLAKDYQTLNVVQVKSDGTAPYDKYIGIPEFGDRYALYNVEIQESGWFDLGFLYDSGDARLKQTNIYLSDALKTSFTGNQTTAGWGIVGSFDPANTHIIYAQKGSYLLKVEFLHWGLNAHSLIFTPVPEPKWVSGIQLNQDHANMMVGFNLQLEAELAPADATNQSVVWKSSDTSVATVDPSGKVYAVSPGHATITATAADKGRYDDQVFAATSDITVEQRPFVATIESASGKVGNIFVNAEAYDLSLELQNRTAAQKGVNITATVKSQDPSLMDPVTLIDDENKTVLPGDEGKIKMDLDLSSIIKYGNFDVDLKLEYDGIVQETSFPFSRSLSVTSDTISSDSIMGVCTHFAQIGWMSKEQQDQIINNNLDILQKAGIKWIRDEMYWSENPKGNLIIEDLWKRYVKAAKDRGINILLVLGYGNSLYDAGYPRTDEGIAAYTRYAANIAQTFKDDIQYFEVWNEWSGGSLGSASGQPADLKNPEYYVNLLVPTAEAIKAVNPDAKIVAGATVGGDWSWLNGMLRGNAKYSMAQVYDLVDAVSMHPYSYPMSPEFHTSDFGSVVDNEDRAIGVMQAIVTELKSQDGKDRAVKPVWFTEIGWPTSLNYKGSTQERSAAYLSRTIAYGKANAVKGNTGRIGGITLYDFMDDGTNPNNDEEEFGMINSYQYDEISQTVPWSAKSGYVALSAYNALVTPGEFVKDHSSEYDNGTLANDIPSANVYEFKRPNGNPLLMMWTNDDQWKSGELQAPPTQEIKLAAKSEKAIRYDMYGNSEELPVTDGKITLTITEQPTYLEFVVNQATTYTVTVASGITNGTVSVDKTTAEAGQTVNVTVTPADGYQLKAGSLKGDGAAIAGNKFTMPAKNVEVTAEFEVIPSDPTPTSTPTPTPTPAGTPTPTPTGTPGPVTTVTDRRVISKVSADTVVDDKGTATAAISDAVLADAISKAAAEADRLNGNTGIEIRIELTAPATAKAVEAELSRESLNKFINSKADTFVLITPLGTITFGKNTISSISKQATGTITLTAAKVDASTLSAEVRQKVGDRPVVSFEINHGAISSFGSNATLTIPYTLKAGENPHAIVSYYIDAAGNLETVRNGKYDAAAGAVTFKTPHFSNYAVGYDKVDFKDVASGAWYADAIIFAAARGITNGIGNEIFGANQNIDRAQSLVMIMRAFGIAADEEATDNFSDAGNAYYTGYLAAAKRLGITNGVGDNKFDPEKQVTRQEMFTLVYNTLNSLGELPTGNAAKDLNDFKDAAEVSDFAKNAITVLVKTGIIAGTNGELLPTDHASRAEFAKILYEIMTAGN